MMKKLSYIYKSDAGLLALALLLLFLIGVYEGGLIRATRGVAAVLLIFGVGWVVSGMLMWAFRKQVLNRTFFIVFLIVVLSAFLLVWLNRSEYILVASVPGVVMGVLGFIFVKK